jgi:hypothetical protein
MKKGTKLDWELYTNEKGVGLASFNLSLKLPLRSLKS